MCYVAFLVLSTQDFKATRPYTVPIMLACKLAVGCIVGATYLPNRASSLRQVAALMAVFAFMFFYMACHRPYLVPAANVFEAVVALAQFCCVGLNVWFLHRTALGVTMAPEEAAGYMHALMLISIIAMLLRFVAARPDSAAEHCCAM